MITLLIQIAVTIVAARAFGAVMRRFGQPVVIGEIVAGIALGPTLFGAVAPNAYAAIFPAASLKLFKLVADIGLVLFMIQVGFEFDLQRLRGRGRAAMVISNAAIVIPLAIGFAVALPMSSLFSFAAFIGVAMSITAFPVLARILKERGMTTTPLGVMAITCAALNDLIAWSLFAALIAVSRGHSLSISVYAVFIAFAAGMLAPIGRERRYAWGAKMNAVTRFLLPLFFAYSGLRTQIALLHGAAGWTLCAILVLAATAGKLGGTAFAARFCRWPWSESLMLGALMNSRGLMELVALNIGLDLRFITPQIFAAMVIMAVATTFATAPLLTWFESVSARRAGALPRPADAVPPATP